MQRTVSVIVVIALSTACAGRVVAEPVPDAAEADAHYRGERWAQAADAYGVIADAEPGNARAWYRLGVSLSETGRHDAALDALEKARDNGTPVGFVDFQRARALAGAGRGDTALDALEAAVAGGFTQFEMLTADERFAAIAASPRFTAALDKARAARFPCENDARFRAFDFWIGDWDVHTADGTLAGTNRITSEEHGCYLLERWTSASGGSGTSMNFFDPRSGQWTQVWSSAGGLLIEIHGGITDGSMVLTGEAHYASNGQTAPFRGTWTPLDDGRVRQFFEQSSDGGDTWAPWFEGFYSRRDASGSR